jgi:hypothetical protein
MIHRWCDFSRSDQSEFGRIFVFMEKKRLPFIAIVWIAGTVFALPDAMGQSPQDAVQTALPPGVEIHTKAMPKIATVGDPIRIVLDITAPSGYRVEFPKIETHIGDFAILEFSPGNSPPSSAPPSSAPPPQAFQTHSAQTLVALYKTGKFTFPPMLMKLIAPDGKQIALSSSPVIIEIQSVLSDKNQELKDLKRQAEMPEQGWFLWLAIGAVFVMGATIWILRRRKRPPVMPLSPEQARGLIDRAEADLRALLARGFPGNGNEKQFYVLLSEIEKRVLEAGYEIHAAERTTSEIISSLHGKPDMQSGTIDIIESFLFRCDAVKFARYAPHMVEHKAASNDALQILAEARKAVGSRQPAAGSEGTGQ